MKRLCVFAGSAVGRRPEYADAARGLAGEMAHRGLGLVYGGGVIGLMGVLADTALADAFVALPGGLGTFEETLEMLTWSQLGVHAKPVGVLNVAGYYDGLLRWLSHAVSEGFLKRDNLALLLFGDTPPELLDLLAGWRPPPGPRAWLDRSQT